jgi:hypothetical protein
VRGTATDDGPASVNVNGHAASVAADGKWSVAVPLHEGANILVATATDTDGNTARAQRTVTRPTGNPPPPPPQNHSPPSTQPIPSTPLTPSNQFTLRVNKAGEKSIKLVFAVPGTGAIRAKLTASIGGAARTVTLATARKTAKAAGRVTVTLRLGKKARALVRARHKLRARLSATFTPTGGTARTKLKRVTLRAARSAR